MIQRPAVVLDPRDNVATVLQDVQEGETVRVEVAGDVVDVVAREAIALCHKVALHDLAAGERVIKYGECVGETTAAVPRGAWVHVHNMRSRRARSTAA